MMDVDFVSNIKSLTIGIAQYQSNKCENNLSRVLRHIEVLLGGLKLADIQRFFNARSVLGSQCITCMVKLLSELGTDSHLLSKVVELLNTLSEVSEVCDHLQDSFSVASILCGYVVQHSNQERYSHIIPHVLLLLGRITYKRQVSSSIAHLNQVLEYLLRELENGESDTILPCMKVLNNLVSNNLSVQVHIKSMLTSKRTKNLMQFLKQGTHLNTLALSILTSIFWGDDIGKKLYHGQNWFRAMKIIFSTLFVDENIEAQSAAADLCIELLKHNETARQIALYEEEHSCTIKLFDLLDTCSPATSKILEVILAFCSIGLARSTICKHILNNGMRCWKILLKTATLEKRDLTMPVEKSPSLLALALVREVCEEVIESANVPPEEWSNGLFAMINSHLSKLSRNDTFEFKFCLSRALQTLKILLCLSSEDDDFLAKIGESVKCDQLESALEYQLTHNLTGIVSVQPEWSEIGIDVVLAVLELMLRMKHLVSGMEKVLFRVLQDIRMVPFYVAALSSSKSSKVQCALRLHQEASSLPDFPFVLLGEKISEANSKKGNREENAGLRFVHTDMAPMDVRTPRSNFERPDAIWGDIRSTNVLESVSVASISSSSSSEDKENFDALINKMQGKLKGDKKLSGKSAQIMEMYEQKIASLQTKEGHMQDLLDAKALALAQADRLIARNRCQQVQYEEESRRLVQLSKESEMKCEQLLQEIQNVEASRQDVEKELESTVEENRNLHSIAEQYDCLQVAFNDKKHRIEVQERNLAALTQEYDTLKEMHDMFQKHNEKLKTQVNEGVRRLEELEEEKLKLLKDAGDKQMQIHELEGLMMESEKVARQLLDEKSDLEILNKNLQSTVQSLEEEVKSQKMKLATQERARQQLEHQLKERGTEIKKLHHRNEAQEKKTASLYAEKQALTENVDAREKDIKKLKVKLEEQKQTFLKITELSASLQSSQG